MNWRKSTRSEYNGNCAEVANSWRKTRFSISNGACVEVSDGIMVRDTADRDGVTLTFTGAAWIVFTQALRRE